MTPPIADRLYQQLEQILASRIDPQRIITQEAKRSPMVPMPAFIG